LGQGSRGQREVAERRLVALWTIAIRRDGCPTFQPKEFPDVSKLAAHSAANLERRVLEQCAEPGGIKSAIGPQSPDALDVGDGPWRRTRQNLQRRCGWLHGLHRNWWHRTVNHE
jgi:hypothetical protein